MASRNRLLQEANATLIAEGRPEAVAQFFTPAYVAHLTEAEFRGGHTALSRVLAGLRGAFSDLRVDVLVLVEQGDRVAWLRTLRGTQTGAYQGFPATGREVVWRDMVVSLFQEDRIAEEWVVTDMTERLLKGQKGKG